MKKVVATVFGVLSIFQLDKDVPSVRGTRTRKLTRDAVYVAVLHVPIIGLMYAKNARIEIL